MMNLLIPKHTHLTGADMYNSLDHLFNDLFLTQEEHSVRVPAVNIIEEEDRYTFEVELPGMTQDDIDVDVDNDILTIRGHRSEENADAERLSKGAEKGKEKEKKRSFPRYALRERYQEFARRFRLPKQIDAAQIRARFANGLLRIELPKTDAAVSVKIQVE